MLASTIASTWHLVTKRVAFSPHIWGSNDAALGFFSEQIAAISHASPAVLDCATCRTPQPMKIELLPSAGTSKANIIVYRCSACGAIRDRKARRAAMRG
jgi:hypothetical protein